MARYSTAARSTPSPERRTAPPESETRGLGEPGRPERVPGKERNLADHPSGPSSARRAVGFVGSAVLLGVLALAVAVAVVPVAVGGSALTVLSPSMVPTYGVGTLVVIRPRPVEQIRIGDVLSFTDRDPATGATRTVTHRVIGVDPGPGFRTKGDANADPDPDSVAATEVKGVAWYSLPKVGGWGSALHAGPGLLVAAGAVLLLVALMLLVPHRRRTGVGSRRSRRGGES